MDGCAVGDDGRYVGDDNDGLLDGDDESAEVVTVGSNGGFVEVNDRFNDGRRDDCDDGRAVGRVDGLGAASNTLWLNCWDSKRKSLNERRIDGPRIHCKMSVEAE